jgi:hypothetical protein
MRTITSARSLRGNTRLVSGQIKIGDTCAAKGLFGIPCSEELIAADPRHLTGIFTTLCTDHLPKVEEDLDKMWEDGHAFGYFEGNDRTNTADGLEENYRRRNIERPVGVSKEKVNREEKFNAEKAKGTILKNLGLG